MATGRIEQPTDEALDCFAHGVAHLIEEQGYQTGLTTAAVLLTCIADALSDERSLEDILADRVAAHSG